MEPRQRRVGRTGSPARMDGSIDAVIAATVRLRRADLSRPDTGAATASARSEPGDQTTGGHDGESGTVQHAADRPSPPGRVPATALSGALPVRAPTRRAGGLHPAARMGRKRVPARAATRQPARAGLEAARALAARLERELGAVISDGSAGARRTPSPLRRDRP